MSKHILILEPSVALQAIITERVRKTDLEPAFDTNGIRLLVTLYNSLPDALLINARNLNPSCTELVRLVKSMERFAHIPVGVFATSDFLFSDEFKTNCGADAFITFSPDTIAADIEALCAKKGGTLARPQKNDLIKAGIVQKLFPMIKSLESIEAVANIVLSMLAECTKIPACALFLQLDGGAEGFFLADESFTEDETRDFLTVCKSDFSEQFPTLDLTDVEPVQLFSASCKHFRAGGIPLSAYHFLPLSDADGKQLGTIHVIKEGAFTTRQMDLFEYMGSLSQVLFHSAVRLRAKLKFERNIRKAFSRFVPEQIIDELVDSADSEAKVGVGEKRDVAILFSDIRSFTNISERNKPEVIVAFLNRYFTTMCTIIKKHGGTIDKFIGDAIMALFGAPVSYEDNAARAVAAACEMREALESVPLGDLILPEGMKFNIGIGIHYGDVIVGSIGSSDKTDYSVIGDNVNLASRLEGLTKQYGSMILVSQSVKDDCPPGTFAFRYLDDVRVKGKANAVPIHAVDRSENELPADYKDAYDKGFSLYKQGVWNLAKEYFEKALVAQEGDKAARLMLERCEEFIANPPEHWDGAIAFTTK